MKKEAKAIRAPVKDRNAQFAGSIKGTSLRENSRGNVGAWAAIGIAVVGGLLAWGIFAIVNQAFADSQVTNTAGCNATVKTSCDAAYQILDGSLQFQLNAVDQLPTAGTILGVMLIVAIVGAFGFLGYSALKSRM